MKKITVKPVTGIGLAATLTMATIAGAEVRQTSMSTPALRTEMVAVQLQALTVSAVPVSPVAAATAAVTVDPVQIVTDIVTSALSVAASAVWFAAFPITLPLSILGGLVMNVVANVTQTKSVAANDPLIGVSFFFAAPNILLTSGFANVGLSLNVFQHQFNPFTMAATPRAAASRKAATDTPVSPGRPVAARSAKKPAVAVTDKGSRAANRAAAQGR